jgi:hypothetical protein
MINNFIVKAIPEKNQLKIILDGFFMKSEIELAMHLARNESKKLIRGYDVLIDITRFKSANKIFMMSYDRIRKLLKLMGSGEIKFIGINYAQLQTEGASVGFFPYKNGWFS